MTRPTLTEENAPAYLDWLANNGGAMLPHDRIMHLALAELLVRCRTTTAQGKATQHTLVEDGVIEPPPQAS